MNSDKFTVEVYQNERDWLKARLNGVGASEGSAVVRLSRFCSEFGLYWRKVEGRFESDDQAASMAEMADAGHRHERTIGEWFMEQRADHGMAHIEDPGSFTIYRSTERPHVFFTPDRMVGPVQLSTECRKPLQLKCAWYEAAKAWRERVPVSYQVQAQQELYVSGSDEGFFAVLLDGYRFAWYRVVRHERFIARLVDKLDAFWERVQKREPPDVDGSQSSLHALFEMHPQHVARVVELPDELATEAQRMWDQGAKLASSIEKRKDELKARIQLLMGSALYAALPDGSGFSWSRNGKSGTFKRIKKVRYEDVAA